MDRIIIERIDHVAVVVTDVDRARAFYRDVLGMTEVPRPASFDFPGAWFEAGPDASNVVHLLGRPEGEGGGRHHFCLCVSDVHAAARHVESCGAVVIWETKYKIIGIDRFFTADPDDNRIEIQGPEKGASSPISGVGGAA